MVIRLGNRRGASKLGCLVMLLLVSAVGYFGVNVGRHLLKYYELKEAMRAEARYAASRSDVVIKRRLSSLVDSLGLPESARNIQVRRGDHTIWIWTEYYVHIEFPGFVKEIDFLPQAQGPF